VSTRDENQRGAKKPRRDQRSERQSEREQEDRSFTSVIVKRTDEAMRHPDDVLDLAIREGEAQAKRRVASLVLSAVGAGAILAFTALAVGVMSQITGAGEASPLMERLSTALVYPLGFVLCLMSRTQLFTEHTALAVYPVLDRKCGVSAMLRVWGLVLAGNLAGCVLGAVLLYGASGVVQASDGFAAVAEHTLGFGTVDTLLSAVLAGWLMALGGWLLLATPPDFSQIVVIYMATFLIGLGGLHHSIAGASELLTARFTGADVPLARAAATIGLAVIGNLAGGALFVAVLNYGHVRQTQSD